MPIVSEAQRKRLQELAKEGKLKPETLDRMEEDLGYDPLPDRVTWPKQNKIEKIKVLRPIKTPGGRKK